MGQWVCGRAHFRLGTHFSASEILLEDPLPELGRVQRVQIFCQRKNKTGFFSSNQTCTLLPLQTKVFSLENAAARKKSTSDRLQHAILAPLRSYRTLGRGLQIWLQNNLAAQNLAFREKKEIKSVSLDNVIRRIKSVLCPKLHFESKANPG